VIKISQLSIGRGWNFLIIEKSIYFTEKKECQLEV
jgi:hypothetical protein